MQERFIRISYKIGDRIIHRYFSALSVGCEKINKEFKKEVLNYVAIRQKKFPQKVNGFSIARITIERKPNKKRSTNKKTNR